MLIWSYGDEWWCYMHWSWKLCCLKLSSRKWQRWLTNAYFMASSMQLWTSSSLGNVLFNGWLLIWLYLEWWQDLSFYNCLNFWLLPFYYCLNFWQ